MPEPWWAKKARQICKEFRLETVPDKWDFLESDGNYAKYESRKLKLLAICSIDHMPHAKMRHVSISKNGGAMPNDEDLMEVVKVFFQPDETVYTLKRPNILGRPRVPVEHLIAVQWGFEPGCDRLIRKAEKV